MPEAERKDRSEEGRDCSHLGPFCKTRCGAARRVLFLVSCVWFFWWSLLRRFVFPKHIAGEHIATDCLDESSHEREVLGALPFAPSVVLVGKLEAFHRLLVHWIEKLKERLDLVEGACKARLRRILVLVREPALVSDRVEWWREFSKNRHGIFFFLRFMLMCFEVIGHITMGDLAEIVKKNDAMKLGDVERASGILKRQKVFGKKEERKHMLGHGFVVRVEISRRRIAERSFEPVCGSYLLRCTQYFLVGVWDVVWHMNSLVPWVVCRTTSHRRLFSL